MDKAEANKINRKLIRRFNCYVNRFGGKYFIIIKGKKGVKIGREKRKG